MDNSAMTEECCIVLKLGADVRYIESTVDFQEDMGTVGDLNAHIVVTAPDVAGSPSIAVTGGHCLRTLRGGYYGGGEGGICV